MDGAGPGGLDGSPEDVRWLRRLMARSPLLVDAGLRRSWLRVVPHVTVDLRYEIAAALLEAETSGDR